MKKYLVLLCAICAFLATPLSIFGKISVSTNTKSAHVNTKTETVTVQEQPIKPHVLELTLGDPEDSEMGLLGVAFKNYVHQASKGRLDIHLAYSGGLDADETYQFHRVQTGKLDMALGGVGNLSPMVRDLGVVTLPYLFPDAQAVIKGTTGKAAELLNSYAEKANLRILAWTYYGYRYISNNKRPIRNMEDMKGLRIRVPQSMVMIKTYRAFGAIPMPIAWPMTYSALKNDLVDGQCYDYNGFKVMKFHNAGQKYISELHYLYNLQPLVINEDIFDTLPKSDQQVLLDAGKHIQDLSLQYQREMNVMAMRALQDEGVHITKIEDETPWREVAINKVWPIVIDSLGGKQAVNEYLKACGLPLWEPEEADKAAQPKK